MPQISRHQLPPKIWNKSWKHLLQLVHSSDDSTNEIIIKSLLTPTEQVMVTKRLMAALLLLSEWQPYHIIDVLKLSPTTIYKLKLQLDLSPEYCRELKRRFPHPIIYQEKYHDPNWFAQLLDDIFAGYHDRSRLYYR